jgi:hypothetical protein
MYWIIRIFIERARCGSVKAEVRYVSVTNQAPYHEGACENVQAYNSTYSLRRHYMDASGLVHAPIRYTPPPHTHTHTQRKEFPVTILVSFMGWGEAESTWYCGHCLAYCIDPG